MSRSEAGCQYKHYCINCICWLKQPKNSLVSIAGFIIQYWNATISVRWMCQQIQHKSICKECLTAVIWQAAQLHRTVAFNDTACSRIPEPRFSFQSSFVFANFTAKAEGTHALPPVCIRKMRKGARAIWKQCLTLLFELSLLIEEFTVSLLCTLEALFDLEGRKSLQPNRGTQCWWISPMRTRRSVFLPVSMEIISAIPHEVSSSMPPNEWHIQTDLSLIQTHLQLTFLKLMLSIPGEAHGITHWTVLISKEALTLADNEELSLAEALFSSTLTGGWGVTKHSCAEDALKHFPSQCKGQVWTMALGTSLPGNTSCH